MTEKTSKEAASAAARVLRDPNASEDAKSAAGSALTQRETDKGMNTEQERAAIEADRKRRGEPVGYRLVRRTSSGDWVTDGRSWCDGAPPADLLTDTEKSGHFRIEYVYGAPQPAEPVGYIMPSAFKQLKAGGNAIVGGVSQGGDVPLYTAPQPAEPGSGEPVAFAKDGNLFWHGDHLAWREFSGELYLAPQPAEPVTIPETVASDNSEPVKVPSERQDFPK